MFAWGEGSRLLHLLALSVMGRPLDVRCFVGGEGAAQSRAGLGVALCTSVLVKLLRLGCLLHGLRDAAELAKQFVSLLAKLTLETRKTIAMET